MIKNKMTAGGAGVILDSGERTEFNSGAVRDMREGKGRCDLLPLNVIGAHYEDLILLCISEFQNSGAVGDLYDVLSEIPERFGYGNSETMFLELAKHFAEGAKKYGVDNWKKGIPVWCYIDSAVRHYLKWLRGDKDEPHDRAFTWNIICAIWTCECLPELNDYGQMKNTKRENANAN